MSICVDAFQNKSFKLELVKYESEERIVEIILDLLRTAVPKLLLEEKGCDNEPMRMDETAIDFVPPQFETKYFIVLSPTSQKVKYSESIEQKEVKYGFEVLINANSTDSKCLLWELIKVKNIVEAVLISSELYIDHEDNPVTLDVSEIRFFDTQSENYNYFRRAAMITFSASLYQFGKKVSIN